VKPGWSMMYWQAFLKSIFAAVVGELDGRVGSRARA
jgi:hypothetical protein